MPEPDPQPADLIEQFVRAAICAAATVERIPATADLLDKAIQRALGDAEEVLFALSGDVDPMLFSIFENDPRLITKPTKEQFDLVRAGVTDAFCAVAATGSICVAVSKASMVTMLARTHIAVVQANTIVPRPRDVFSSEYLSGRGQTMSFSFITGPSATADMGPLVRGVHGPGRLHIIIVE